MYVYLIRHGQSANNLLYAQTGSDTGRDFDPPLTDLGERQAEALARFIASGPLIFKATHQFGISETFSDPVLLANGAQEPCDDPDPCESGDRILTHLYTSLMRRAVQTALPTARALGLPLTGWLDLHEGGGLFLEDLATHVNVGQPGPDRVEMAARFPELVWPADLGDGPWWNRPFEEKPERLPRARRVLEELLRHHPPESDDRVAFFTHAAFTNYFLAAVLGFEDRAGVWFSMYNCGITRIRFRPQGEPVILYSGQIDHLPQELVSG